MILECNGLWKTFNDGRRTRAVLRGASVQVSRGEILGLLGNPGAGKSLLLDILVRKTVPDRGGVSLRGVVSVPVGSRGWFSRKLSPDDNVRFLASLFSADQDAAIDYVRSFAQLNAREWHRPWSEQPGAKKGLIAFAAGLSVPCDLYLLDGNPIVEGPGLRDRCYAALAQRATESAILWTARRPKNLQHIAQEYAVLSKGKLSRVASRKDALERLGLEAA